MNRTELTSRPGPAQLHSGQVPPRGLAVLPRTVAHALFCRMSCVSRAKRNSMSRSGSMKGVSSTCAPTRAKSWASARDFLAAFSWEDVVDGDGFAGGYRMK